MMARPIQKPPYEERAVPPKTLPVQKKLVSYPEGLHTVRVSDINLPTAISHMPASS
jgi:hypothetical protein